MSVDSGPDSQAGELEGVRTGFYNQLMDRAPIDRELPPRQILFILPNWVGDMVLATPALAALRTRFPGAHVTGLMKAGLRDVLAGSPWIDEQVFWEQDVSDPSNQYGLLNLAGQLRDRAFELAVVFPNSFRSALLCRLAGIRRRVGYARECRGFLLTDRLLPERENGTFKILPVHEYYGRLALHLRAPTPSPLPTLHTTREEEARLDAYLVDQGVDADRPFVVLNPGGQYGAAKCWMPDRYAAVGDALRERLGAEVFINVGPHETQIAEQVMNESKTSVHSLATSGLGLGGLKALVRRSALMITNDTGPRHFAIAFDVPVVTLFGPTHPGWTQTCYAKERIVSVPVDCGPCQKRVCPLDHRCMTGIREHMVLAAAMELLTADRTGHVVA